MPTKKYAPKRTSKFKSIVVVEQFTQLVTLMKETNAGHDCILTSHLYETTIYS